MIKVPLSAVVQTRASGVARWGLYPRVSAHQSRHVRSKLTSSSVALECKTQKMCLVCPQGSCFNFTSISQYYLPISQYDRSLSVSQYGRSLSVSQYGRSLSVSQYGRGLSISQHDSCQWKLAQHSWIPPVSVISACSSTLLMPLFVSSVTVH